jgi:hypothetical protein
MPSSVLFRSAVHGGPGVNAECWILTRQVGQDSAAFSRPVEGSRPSDRADVAGRAALVGGLIVFDSPSANVQNKTWLDCVLVPALPPRQRCPGDSSRPSGKVATFVLKGGLAAPPVLIGSSAYVLVFSDGQYSGADSADCPCSRTTGAGKRRG